MFPRVKRVSRSMCGSYFGTSAMSLTSAMTSLCSISRCLRRTSFRGGGTDSAEQADQRLGAGTLNTGGLEVSAGWSGKHSGSRMLSLPEKAEERLHLIYHTHSTPDQVSQNQAEARMYSLAWRSISLWSTKICLYTIIFITRGDKTMI